MEETYLEVLMYNEKCYTEFSNNRTPLTFEKYIMSEIQSPIQDYEAVIEQISEYPELCTDNILIIGSHLMTDWSGEENCALQALKRRLTATDTKTQAIYHYLYAYHLDFRRRSEVDREIVKAELLQSLSYDGPFVHNRLLMSKIDPPNKQAWIREAKKNVVRCFSLEECKVLPMSHFVDPKSFIAEFILGTELPQSVYEMYFNEDMS